MSGGVGETVSAATQRYIPSVEPLARAWYQAPNAAPMAVPLTVVRFQGSAVRWEGSWPCVARPVWQCAGQFVSKPPWRVGSALKLPTICCE